MTVASETSSIEYAGNGSTTAFSIPFGFLSNSDIQVSTRDADGDTAVLSTGFSVTGAGTGSGTCTFTTAPASGTTVVIERAPEILQPVDYVANDRFPAETHEAALDRQTYIGQYLARQVQGALRFPVGDAGIGDDSILPAASSRKGKLLYFDATYGFPETLAIADVSGVSTAISSSMITSLLNSFKQTSAEIAVAVTPTDYTVQSHVGLGYVNAARYGFSTGATGSTNYTALVNAHAVAVQAGVALVIPDGTYTYTPTAAINFAVNVFGEGMPVLNCAMSSYSGTVFQVIGSTVVHRLYMNRTGTKQGTAIRLSPVTTSDFTGYQELNRVWAIGFGVNIDIENLFLTRISFCRFNSGTTGIRCVPDTIGATGYDTTLLFDTVEALGNDQNHLFTSTLQSRCIKFLNCSFENPVTTASTFTRCRELEFDNCYFEGSNTIRAVILTDCTASFTNPYLNGTNGISLGTNTEVVIQGARVGSVTDLLVGGDSTQIVTLIDCQFPASGNSLSYLRLNMVNTQINGTWYEGYYGPRSSFTATLTGCTTSPTATVTYSVNNDEAVCLFPALTATSNTTSCTITGIPAAIRPATTQYIGYIAAYDNGVNVAGIAQVNTSGVLTLFNGVNAAGFTSSGTKGLNLPTKISWKLTA